MKKCLLEVWNSKEGKSNFIEGIIINETNGYCGENFNRYDVETKFGIFYSCHPDCIKNI